MSLIWSLRIILNFIIIDGMAQQLSLMKTTGSSNNTPNFTWELKNNKQIVFNGGTTFDLSISNSQLIMGTYGNINIIDSQNGNEKRIGVNEQVIYN